MCVLISHPLHMLDCKRLETLKNYPSILYELPNVPPARTTLAHNLNDEHGVTLEDNLCIAQLSTKPNRPLQCHRLSHARICNLGEKLSQRHNHLAFVILKHSPFTHGP